MDELPAESWLEAEPRRYASERQAMAGVAPDLSWLDGPTGGWRGLAPEWPFGRPSPEALDAFLAGHRFELQVEYSQAFPMEEPKIWPLDPSPDPLYRTQHDWHVNPDGSLCLLQAATSWTGIETAADLVVKAAGWFLEYLLMDAGLIEHMSENGIANDDSLDHFFSTATPGAV